jgi:hypothetical protein
MLFHAGLSFSDNDLIGIREAFELLFYLYDDVIKVSVGKSKKEEKNEVRIFIDFIAGSFFVQEQ